MLQLLSCACGLHVLLIRHGETSWNVEGRVQGSADSALTEQGVQQAIATGRRLSGGAVRAVYSSPLPRARRTAELIVNELSFEPALHVLEEPRLAERSFGIFEGQRWSAIREKYPLELAASQADPGYAMPDGESRLQVVDRAYDFLQTLAEAGGAAGTGSRGAVVVVTHSGLISCVLKRILGLEQQQPRTFDVPNLGIIDLEWAPGGEWLVRTLGDVAHLESISTGPRWG